MADEVVLNFQDSLLRKSDVKLLEEGQWLNDKIIGFMFEYFEYILFNKLENVLFVNPDVAQYIKLCEGAELAIFLEPLHLHCKDTIIIPVNSNENPEVPGGTHWSLLLYDKQLNIFHHYDSSTPSNHSNARQICMSVQPFLQVEENAKFVEETCPRQENSYDCGMYVICITETLCNRIHNKTSLTETLRNEVNAGSVKRKRIEIQNIIKDLRKTHLS